MVSQETENLRAAAEESVRDNIFVELLLDTTVRFISRSFEAVTG